MRGSSIGSRGLVNSSKSGLDRFTGINTLGDNVGKESVLIAKEIHTVRSVEELLGQITKEVVLDEVLLGDDTAGGSQDQAGGATSDHSSVGGVQLEVGGPSVLVDVILDIRCVGIIDIERVRLELEDSVHISQLDVVDGNGANIQSSGSLTGELTGNTESKRVVEGGKSEINSRHFVVIIKTNILFFGGGGGICPKY